MTAVKHVKPWCCYSRLGKAKVAYPSIEKAKRAKELAEKRYGDKMVVYPCTQRLGYYHVRKARPEEVAK